jgi:hypothetical protein
MKKSNDINFEACLSLCYLLRIFLIVLLIIQSARAISQQELTCTFEESINQQLLDLGSNSECADFLNYIPDEHTQMIYIKVNFHFIAKEDPFNPMNYTATWDGVDADNNYTGYDYAEGVMNMMNERLSVNGPMNMMPGNATPVLDRKYRFVLSGVHFWESDFYWGNLFPNELLDTFGINVGEEINVFFQSHTINDAGILGGRASIGVGRSSIIIGGWNEYLEYSIPNYWLSAYEVLHETGHNLTLPHTMRYGANCSMNFDDGFTDTPTRAEVISMGFPDPCCPSAYTSPECSNNMMDYSTEDVITPQQLGKIHYVLTHEMINYIDQDYCERNPLLDETIAATENLTWNNVRIFRGDLILEPGARLTIRCDVYMAHSARIIVKEGAVLTLDGGRVTHRCSQLWEGIEVWGNKNEDQAPESNQGKIVIKNHGTIEWAENGIHTIRVLEDGSYDWTKTGGIVQCTDANFLNNIRSVAFMSYQNHYQQRQIDNRSYFKNSHFEITDVSRFPNQAHNCFISMWDVNGVKIYGCDFKNSAQDISIDQRGNGLFTIQSTYKIGDYCFSILPTISPCPPADLVRSRFENLNYAVRSAGINKAMLLSINHAQFINNRGGIYLSGFGQSQIIYNDFNWNEIIDLSQVQTFGVYLEECKGYEVEENFFDAHDGEETYGIAVNNSGKYATEIYRNIFHRCKVASMVYGINRDLSSSSDDHHGLQWKCNNYGNVDDDSKMNYYGIALYNNASQASFQGNFSEHEAAGNLFFPECDAAGNPSTQERELKLMEQEFPSYYDYIHSQNLASKPECRTFGIGLLNSGALGEDFGLEYCQTDVSSEKLPIHHYNLVGFNHNIYSQLKASYDGYVNNGTGTQLKELINDPTISSIEIRNSLLDAAPTVSDELLIAALHRTPKMDGWHMAQSLTANSPLKEAVLVELEGSDYLEFYKNYVNINQPYGLSTRTLLAMDATQYRSEQDNSKDDLFRSYALSGEDGPDWTQLEEKVYSIDYCIEPWEKGSIYFEKGDLAGANEIIGNCFDDNAHCQLLNLAIEMNQLGMAPQGLPTSIATELASIANNSQHLMSATASLYLEYWGGPRHEEFLALPENGNTKLKQTGESTVVKEVHLISLFPNPANEQLGLNFILPAEVTEKACINIYNSLGVLIQSWKTAQINGNFEIVTKEWPAGIYSVELCVEGKQLETVHLSIVH